MSVANKAICTWSGIATVANTQVYTARQSRNKHTGVYIWTQVRIIIWQLFGYLHPAPSTLALSSTKNVNTMLNVPSEGLCTQCDTDVTSLCKMFWSVHFRSNPLQCRLNTWFSIWEQNRRFCTKQLTCNKLACV